MINLQVKKNMKIFLNKWGNYAEIDPRVYESLCYLDEIKLYGQEKNRKE